MALTGSEILQVLGVQANGQPSSVTQQTTTGAIAALASTESSPFISTSITTVGNGILTAAGLVGGQIIRTGPTAVYTDTTDTAANIVAALPGLIVGETFSILIKNATAFTQTIAAGTGVTLPLTVIVPAFSIANYIATVNSGTAVTLIHIDTTPVCIGTTVTAPSSGALTTVGNGTLTAALMFGGITSRTGPSGAFTDTTDTAANIVSTFGNLVNKIGSSTVYTYVNNSGFSATLTGGSGVTVSGITVIPAGQAAEYLITYTAANTLTMVGVGMMAVSQLLSAQFATGTTTTTFAAGQLTGGNFVVYTNTGATPGSIATRTATQMIADIPNAYVGQTYMLRVINGQATGTLTITAGTGITLTGTATVAANTTRDFVVTITSTATPAITIQNAGTGTFS